MAINPQIVVPQVQGIQLENPLALARNAMAIQEAKSTIATNQLKANRAAAAASIFQKNAGKPPEEIANALFAAGLPDEAENVMKYQTAGGQSTKALREAEVAGLQLLGSEAGAFANDPASLNKAAIMPWATAAVQRGLLSPEALRRFEAMPDDPRALSAAMRRLQVQALTPQQQLQQEFTNLDLGGTRRVIATPQYGTGPSQVVYEAPISPSPNAPRTTITNVLPGQEKFATELAVGAAKNLDTLRTGATSAARSIQTIDRLRPLLDDPKFISGTWANARIAISRALGQDVSATETYFAGIAGEVAERIKAFGAGTGLSDKDREFAEKWAGGKPDLSAKGIKRILEINEKSSRNVIDTYNTERARLARDVSPAVNQYYPEVAYPNAPPVGTVSKGYRFKGGDPRNEANWEKVK